MTQVVQNKKQKEFFQAILPFLSPLQTAMLESEIDYLLAYQEMQDLNQQTNALFDNADDARRKFEPLFLRLNFESYQSVTERLKNFTAHEVHPDVNPQDIFLWIPDISIKMQHADGHIKIHFGGHYTDPAIFLDHPQKTIRQKGNHLRDFFFTATLLSRFPSYQVDVNLSKKKHNADEFSLSSRRNYFSRILLGRKPSIGLDFLSQHSILQLFLPEITAGIGLNQNQYHSHDIYHHLLFSCDGMQNADLILRLSALLHDAGKVPTRKEKENGEATFYNHEMVSARMIPTIMKRLGIGKEIGLEVRFLVRNHMFHYTDEWTDKAIRRFIKKIPPEHLSRLIELRIADRKGSGKRNYFPPALTRLLEHIQAVNEKEQEFKITDLAIGGKDLMELGLPSGPLFGTILKELADAVKKDELPNEKEKLLQKAKEIATQKGNFILTQ